MIDVQVSFMINKYEINNLIGMIHMYIYVFLYTYVIYGPPKIYLSHSLWYLQYKMLVLQKQKMIRFLFSF